MKLNVILYDNIGVFHGYTVKFVKYFPLNARSLMRISLITLETFNLYNGVTRCRVVWKAVEQ